MKPTKPNVHPEGRYRIKDACEALGVHRHTLRKYTDSGEIRYRLRRGGNKKFYLGREIIRFWEANT